MTKRDKIIEAAQALMSEKALDKITMRDIAKRADVSLGLSYSYFQNREEIFTHIQHWAMRRVKKSIVHLKNGDLRAYLEFIIDDMQEHKNQWRALYQMSFSPMNYQSNAENLRLIESMLSLHIDSKRVQSLLASIFGVSVMLLFVDFYEARFEREEFINQTLKSISD